MKKTCALIAIWLLAGSLTAGCATGHGGAEAGKMAGAGMRRQLDDAVAKVKPALVRIKVVTQDDSDGRKEKNISFGSGTIVSPDGYIVTNHHVAARAVQLVCTLPNREEVPARLVGTDAMTDIAVIQLTPAKPTQWPFAEFGDSDAVRVGDPVVALGSPLSLSQSVTAGIISNTEMIMPEVFGSGGFDLDGENVGELVRWFGHDAQIEHGNSGGPLVDMQGRIVGVNELSFGLAGAIPANIAKKVADQLIAKGEPTRAYTGLRLQPILRGDWGKGGVLVATVLKKSPADNAGLKEGDVILSIAGTPVDGRFKEDLPGINNVMADLPVGQPASFEIRRGGETMTLQVIPDQRQPVLLETVELREWGMTVRNLSVWTALDRARESKSGVLVTSVRSGGPVSKAKPELRWGDIITRVADREIRNEADLVAATKDLMAGKAGFVPTIVTFERESETFVASVEIGIDKLQDPAREARKAWLPIETQVVTPEIAAGLGMAGGKGARVTRIYRSAPAGFPFKVGDVITHVDGDAVDASRPADADTLNTMIRQYSVGTSPEFTVMRGGKAEKFACALMESPRKSREMQRWRDLDFEFEVREATFNDKERSAFAGSSIDVVADTVTRGGWANLGGLNVGDAILSINGQAVKTVEDVKSAMEKVRAEKAKSVVIFVRRNTQYAYLEMEPKW